MINKLLDQPYWDEFPKRIEALFGHELIYLGNSYRNKPILFNVTDLLGYMVFENFNHETEPNRKHWSAKRVIHHAEKHLSELKEPIIWLSLNYFEVRFKKNGILDENRSWYEKYKHRLNSENNLEVLFLNYEVVANAFDDYVGSNQKSFNKIVSLIQV